MRASHWRRYGFLFRFPLDHETDYFSSFCVKMMSGQGISICVYLLKVISYHRAEILSGGIFGFMGMGLEFGVLSRGKIFLFGRRCSLTLCSIFSWVWLAVTG